MAEHTVGQETENLNYRAAVLSMAAGVIHAIAVSQYIGEWWGYGIFFIAAAVVQILYGVLLLIRPWRYDETGGIRSDGTGNARTIYLVGAIGNSAIFVLFLITRTFGIPLFGPMAGMVEPFDPLGVLAQIIHLVLIFHLIVLIRRTSASASESER